MIKLSIIIPVYNVEQYLEKCLLSCLSQDVTHDEYEIIVVNDGSPDGSLAIAECIAKRYTNITIISQNNGGLSAARNIGISVARGEYIWFVDSDDWIQENCLKELLNTLYEDSLDALVINGIRVTNGDMKKFPPKEFSGYIMSGVEYLNKTLVNCAAVKTIYRKDVLDKYNLRFMEGVYHEDAEFTPRAYFNIKKIMVKNYYFYYNRLNPCSITQSTNPKKSFDLLKVANSLYDYKQFISNHYSICYDKYISSVINQSLHNAIQMDESMKLLFCKELENSKHLFGSLIKSHKLIYKIEGILFIAFPNRCLEFYKFFKKIA